MKKSNKLVAVVLALVMMITAIPMMTAGAAKHEHLYVQQSATEATCEADGQRVFKCSCGDEQVVIEEALGHDFVGTAKKKNESVHTEYCGECKKTIEVKHTFETEGDIKRQPTCTEEGKQEVYCDVCDEKTLVDVKPNGHTYSGDVENKSSSRHEGYCTVCKKDKYEAHQWDKGTETKPASCYKSGEMKFTCTVAGCDATRTEKIAPGHAYSDWAKVDGGKYHSHKCEVCNKTIKEAHKFTAEVIEEPDCVSKGTLKLTCVVEDEKGNIVGCGYSTEEEIATVAHNIDKNTYKKYSETKHEGTCKVCYEDIVEECKYEEVKDKTVAATCDKEGSKTLACVCGRTKTETIKKLDHKFGEWKVTKEATATAEGSKERECSVCKYKETAKIDKLAATTVAGDVNGDNKVSAVDARLVLQHVANTANPALTAEQIAAADIVGDKDGVKASDARRILEIVAGKVK
jgi:L-amino acid N-acyltransferase YncA